MSEWKAGAAARRDARATKDEPVAVRHPRKNRKRWCKGKVGVEHRPVIERDPFWDKYGACQPRGWWSGCYHWERCTVCGKVLRRFLGADCPDRKECC
jgi:hypothetical protein